jgi:hypothetical protein
LISAALVFVFSGLMAMAGLGAAVLFVLLFYCMAAAGSIVGSQLMKTRLSSAQLKRIIGLLLWLIAVKMIFDLFK